MWDMPEAVARVILAANLRKLIEAQSPKGQRPTVRAWAMSKGLDVRLIDRMTKGANAVTLDKLEEVATACGLKAWQLLVDDFDPAAPPESPITEEERATIRKLRRLLAD